MRSQKTPSAYISSTWRCTGSKLVMGKPKTGVSWTSTISFQFLHRLLSMKSMELVGRKKNITMRKQVTMVKKSEIEFST